MNSGNAIMRALASLAIVLALSSPCHALDEWTSDDTAWEVTYATLHIIDWGQTRHIAKNPELFHENNPILGKHPSVGKVNTFLALTLAGHVAVARLLPKKARRVWQVVWIGVEASCVAHNASIGIKIDF